MMNIMTEEITATLLKSISKIKNVAANELQTYPHYTRRQKVICWVRHPFRVRTLDRFSWPNTMLAIGLTHDTSVLNLAKTYCDRFIAKGCPIRVLDNTMIGVPMLYLYKETNERKYLDASSKLVTYLKRHQTDTHGSLVYREGSSRVLVDSLGMICPFLSEYSAITSHDDVASIANLQINNFLEYGMDVITGLPYHGYDVRHKLGIIGWGRALGWLLMGMVGYLERDRNSTIHGSYTRLIDTVLNYQDTDGMFHWQLQAKEGPVDTSATAMILNGIYDGIRGGVLSGSYMSHIERGVRSLMGQVADDGRVMNCSAECRGLSMYPQVYSSYPWSTGPTLALLLKLLKHHKDFCHT